MKHFFLVSLKTLAFCTLLLAALSVSAQDLPKNNNGWSRIIRSSDSRVIYCSHSTGNDNNNGLSSGSPVKSLNKAFSLVRNGYPDHVYLKRGDTWTNQTLRGLKGKSGRNGTQRITLAYYGSGNRPLIKVNNQLFYQGDLDHVAILGIEFYNYKADPGNNSFSNPYPVAAGMRTSGNFLNNVLIEDCKFSFFEDAIVMEHNTCNCGDANKNIDIRRNIIVNSYARNSTFEKHVSTGMYLSSMSNLLIEENFFDHNGWNERVSDARANQFNHNVYLSDASSGPTVVRGNVFSRGAAHGLQLRSGGIAEKNAFIGNAIGMNIGYNNPPVYYRGDTYVRNNVVTDGRPQVPNDRKYPQTGAIWGIWKQKINNVTVSYNIVANIQDKRGGNVKPYNEGFQGNPNRFGPGNIAWNWKEGNFPSPQPNWKDPSRDKDTFAKSRGYSSYQAWVNAASRRGIKSLPTKLTAYDYVNYIRAGFNKPAVSRPRYNSNGRLAATQSKEQSFPKALASPVFRAYPNPAREQLSVEGIEDYRVSLYDLTGRKVMQHEHLKGVARLDVSYLRPGVYLLKLRDGERHELRQRILIE